MGEIGVWWSSGSWIATGRPSSSTNAGPKFAEDALGKAILDDGKFLNPRSKRSLRWWPNSKREVSPRTRAARICSRCSARRSSPCSLSPALLEFVEERALRVGAGHGLPSYFLKNDFFCGVDGKKAAQRLDHAEQLLACQVMAAVLDSGRTISLSYVAEKARPPCYSGKKP